jgi:tRNA(fMet)-specific endonuclease VapC
MKRYLLDTNAISQLMRAPQGDVQQTLRQRVSTPTGCEVTTSAVVQCELLYGIVRKGSQKLMSAYAVQMRHLEVLPIDTAVGPHYANLRTALEQTGKSLSPNDMLIAAHAISLNAILVSADAAFAQVPGLVWENWQGEPAASQ